MVGITSQIYRHWKQRKSADGGVSETSIKVSKQGGISPAFLQHQLLFYLVKGPTEEASAI